MAGLSPELLDQLNSDRADRVVSTSTPEVVPVDAAAPSGGLAPPPGTITVYFGDPASETWQQVKSLLRPDGMPGLAGMSPGGAQTLDGRAAVEELMAQPVYGDVRYAGRTLVRSAGLLTDDSYATVTLPYNGGPLRDNEFEVAEHRRGAAPAARDYVVVVRPPELSALEQDLLQRVPEASREIHIGVAVEDPSQDAMDKIANSVKKAAEDALREKHHKAGIQDGRDDLISPEQLGARIDEIVGAATDPAASAVALLNARRRVFGL